jgi:hypothetical protein
VHGPSVTLINVFTVDPTRQDELLELLARATKVTMYAQWQSREAYDAMREDPGPRPYFDRALAMARFKPGMYEVVQTFLPEAGSRPA